MLCDLCAHMRFEALIFQYGFGPSHVLCTLWCGLLCFSKLQVLQLHYSDIEIHHCGLCLWQVYRAACYRSWMRICWILPAQTDLGFLSNISALTCLTQLTMQVPGADEVYMYWLNNMKALRGLVLLLPNKNRLSYDQAWSLSSYSHTIPRNHASEFM